MLSFARVLIIIGVVFVIAGGLIALFARLGVPLGKLPGNIRIEGNNFTCVFALGASILLSIILTVVLNIIVRFMNK
jgi:hypothetical protein